MYPDLPRLPISLGKLAICKTRLDRNLGAKPPQIRRSRHHVHATPANTADVTEVDQLLHGNESDVFADVGVHKRTEHENRDVNWWIVLTGGQRKALTTSQDDRWAETVEKVKAKIRAKVEHPFRVIKQ